MILTIYTDGASRGNPGRASFGFVISEGKEKIYEEGKYIGIATNNIAEYTAVLKALEYITKTFSSKGLTLKFFMDSRFVAEQLSGRFKIKNANLKIIFDQIRTFEVSLGEISYTHVPRAANFAADRMANLALDRVT